MSTVQIAYIGTDLTLQVAGLQNDVTSAYINDAVVTVTVTTAADVEVSGQSWPETLGYVAASDGDYRCTLQDAVAFVDDTAYKAKVTAVGGGLTRYWEIPVVAQVDTGLAPNMAQAQKISADAGTL